MSQRISIWLVCASLVIGGGAQASDTPTASRQLRMSNKADAVTATTLVTLDAAIARALDNAPQIQSAAAAEAASKGELEQAGVWPNPELAVEAENFGTGVPYRGFDAAEVTYGLAQRLELGGKRSAREEVARQGHIIAGILQEVARLDLIRDVTIAYADAVAAREAVRLAEKQRTVAADVLANVSERVNAAAEPEFQKSKSQVALATAEVALDKTRRDEIVTRRRLAALWGDTAGDYRLDTGWFFAITEPEDVTPDNVSASLPDLARWDAELARSEAQLALETANAIPDPTLSAGVRDFRGTGEQAFLIGVSLPLPVFDSNQGNIARARNDVTRTASDKRLVTITWRAMLLQAGQELANAYRQAQNLKRRIIPAAQKAYALSLEGYRAGKFAYLDVLDAQRTLVDVQAQHIETLRSFHAKRAEMERLTAVHCPAPARQEPDHAR